MSEVVPTQHELLPVIPSASDAVVVVRDAFDIDRLKPGWDRLAAVAAATPMQHFEWTRACVDAFGGDLAIVVVGSIGDPVAIAPLVQRAGVLELIGGSELHEPGDLIYRDEAALTALAAHLPRMRRALMLRRLPADSPVPGALARAFRRGRVIPRATPAHPVIHLDDGWAAPEGRLSSRRRQDARRARRRAEELGELTFELHTEYDEAIMSEAFEVEGRGWKGRAGTALAADARAGTFFAAYAESAARAGKLRLLIMRIGGEAVAMQLAIECDERLWLLKIGYDESFARCSPGMLTLLHSTSWAAAKGLTAVQMLGSAEAWTTVYTETVEETHTVHVYPASGRGLAQVSRDAARLAVSRLGR